MAVLVACATYFALVTQGTGSLRGPERWGEAYDSLAQHLPHLDASVEPGTIAWEGFDIDGKKYMYFGPFPALLRVVPIHLVPSVYGNSARLSCLLAACLSLLWAARLAAHALERNPWASAGQRRALLTATVVGFGLGTPLLYLVSCARIYHEAALWGLCGALFSLDMLLRLLAGTISDRRGLNLLSVGFAVTLLSRVTYALPLVLCMLFVVPLAGRRAWRAPERIRTLAGLGLALVPAAAGIVVQMWYNHVRFGSPWANIDYTRFYAHPELLGGEFNLRRLPSSLWNYYGFSAETFTRVPPFFNTVHVQYANDALFFAWKEQATSLTIASSWLVVSALIGVGLLVRRRGLGWIRLAAACFLVQSLIIASYFFVTQRYAAEFLPLLALLLAVCLATARFDRGPMRAFPAALSLLALASAAVTIATTLQWNLVYNGDAPEEYKARLARLLTPDPALPPWSGPRVQLSALQPVSEEYSFVPLRTDSAYSGEPIRFRGREYRHGLGMHARSAVTYAVPPDAIAFQSVAGLTDSVNHCRIASAVFEVRDSDGAALFRTPVLRSTDLPVAVHVDLRGHAAITLAVEDAGDGRDCDHGAWGDAVFLLEPTAPD